MKAGTVSDSCSNNGVRRRFVDLFMAVVALKRTVFDLMQKGK